MVKLHKIANSGLWVSFFLLLVPTIYVVLKNMTILLEWNFLPMNASPIGFSVIFDPWGMIFSCVVILISANVLQFSKVYMEEDKFIDRFTLLVLLFVLSMNMLIYFPHLMMLLLGWDGLGITSFILVIYYQNTKSVAAGMITALTNRIGDVMLLLAIAWTLNQGHWNIVHMWNVGESLTLFQVLCISVAAMTKSAQMPFSSWLPAAMAAPTPVSALVHSSTLVTAGVFLLIRFYPFLSSFSLFCPTMLIVSICTMIMAGLSATTECDMKKIIALSTLSQLGFMMSSLGLGALNLAFFHMVTHAMFKALLFICAGTLIHSFSHSQDLRWMGNCYTQMPVTASCMMMANTALCGFPFMSGFYSKDLIIEFSLFSPNNFIGVSLILFAVGLTSFYSIRFALAVLWSPNNSVSFSTMVENDNLVRPMSILSMVSIAVGAVIIWAMPMSQNLMILSQFSKIASFIFLGLGTFISWILSTSVTNKSSYMFKYGMFHNASCSMWFLVPLSSQFIMKWPFFVSFMFLKLVDQSWLEYFGAGGTHKALGSSSNFVMEYQSYNPINFLMGSSVLLVTILLFIQI